MKKCASEKYLIMRSALDDKSTLVYHAILARIAGKLQLVIRHQPRDKLWKHVPRINYARSRSRNQWTESHPEKEFHGKWLASFRIQIHERSHCGSVSQLWRKRYRKKDNKRVAFNWERSRKNETCHRVNRFKYRV